PTPSPLRGDRAHAQRTPGTPGRLCAEQQQGWQAGTRPRVEDLLARSPAPGPGDDAVLGLVVREVRLRQGQGESPTLDEYLQRFPPPRHQRGRRPPLPRLPPPPMPAAAPPATQPAGPPTTSPSRWPWHRSPTRPPTPTGAGSTWTASPWRV